MAVIQELIRVEDSGTISFGNYLMDLKKKVLDFDVQGDLYKVKTYKEITKLEKNGILLFEAVPGVTVHEFYMDEKKITFNIEGVEDAQITMELEPEQEYKIFIESVQVGRIKANLAGKILFSLDFKDGTQSVKIEKTH